MWGIAAVSFGTTVAYWPGLLSAAVAPRWSLIAAGLPLVCWLDPRRLDPVVLTLLIGGLLYAALSLCWSPSPIVASGEFFHLLIFGAAVLAGASLRDAGPVMVALGLGLSVSAILTVTQTFGWSPVSQILAPAGLFDNRIILAEAVAPVFAWALIARKWFLVAPLGIALLLTQSRIAIFAALCAVVWRWPLLAIPFLCAVLYALLASHFGWAPFHSYDIGSFAMRLTIWQAALSEISLFGAGIGSFALLHPHWEYAHADALQFVDELGIGAIAFIGIFVAALKRWDRRSAEHTALSVLAIELVFSFPLHQPTATLMAGILVGYLARARGAVFDLRSFSGGHLVPAV